MNLNVIITVIIYYGLLYWNVPYELSDKFVNLFNRVAPGASRKKIRCYCLNKDARADLTIWQKLFICLSMPGVGLGKLVNKLIRKIKEPFSLILAPVLVSLILQGFIYIHDKIDIICKEVILAGISSIFSDWKNILYVLLFILIYIIASAFYFAVLFGLFEITTLPVLGWNEEDSGGSSDGSRFEKMLSDCFDALKSFRESIRMPHCCSENDKIVIKKYLISIIPFFAIMYIYVDSTNTALSVGGSLLELLAATGIPSIVLSFIISVIVGYLNRGIYHRMPQKVRNAVGSVIDKVSESAVNTIVEICKDSGSVPPPPPPSSDGHTHFFNNSR